MAGRLDNYIMDDYFFSLSVSSPTDIVFCIFYMAILSLSPITFRHVDKFNPFLSAVCRSVWPLQKLLSVGLAERRPLTAFLTGWLNMWVLCWLFDCHLFGWQLNYWLVFIPVRLIDSLCWQSDWLDVTMSHHDLLQSGLGRPEVLWPKLFVWTWTFVATLASAELVCWIWGKWRKRDS